MTAADPVASGVPDRTRLLDRTGVCGARRGTLPRREKATGRAFDRQIGSTMGGAIQTAASGPDLMSAAVMATLPVTTSDYLGTPDQEG